MRDRHAGIYVLVPDRHNPSFSCQHWKLSTEASTTPLPPPHTVARLSSHLSSIFQGTHIFLGKGPLNFQYISWFSILEMPSHVLPLQPRKLHLSDEILTRPVAKQTCHRTLLVTCSADLWCDNVLYTIFKGHKSWKGLCVVYFIVPSCLKCLHLLVKWYIFTLICSLSFNLCISSRIKTFTKLNTFDDFIT